MNEMQRKYTQETGYSEWVVTDGYNRCRKDICSGQRKMESLHESYIDCVKEMIDRKTFLIWGYSAKFTFELKMQE